MGFKGDLMSKTQTNTIFAFFLFTILFALLSACGGSDKDSDSSGSGDKDKGPASAPTATGPIDPISGASYDLSIVCNEKGEVVTITGEGLEPESQTHTCKASGEEDFSLSLKQGVHFPSPNNLTISSKDQDGNAADKTTMVDVPIDTRTSAPTATAPEDAIFGTSYDLPIVCNEAGEVVSIAGEGLEPNPQTHTCTASGPEDFSLSLKQGVNLSSPNNLTLSSTDQDENPKDKMTMVDVPIDTLSTIVSIDSDSLLNIDASNAKSFTVEGRCSKEGQPVVVSVGGVSPETNPDCTSNSWSVVGLDVTSLNKPTNATISITADHLSSDGESATQASKEVTNSFLCPTNFVGVPSLQGYTTNSFCVMKYEAKNDGSGNAISQAEDAPYSGLNHNNSINKCQDIDVGYDLITNDEWQSIARNIELVGSNWKNGAVGDAGGLSTGHSDAAPVLPLAANSNDNNACHATGQDCNSNTWHSQRRTHTLSNGEVVWDIAGNTWEWVKDTNMVNYGSTSRMSKVTYDTHTASGSLSDGTTTTSRTVKDHFGPSGDYGDLNSDPWGGLGIILSSSAGGGVFRGGDSTANLDSTPNSAGAFSVNLDQSLLYMNILYGFRCVYHP